MSSLYNNAVKQEALLQKGLANLRVSPEDAPSRLVGQVSTSITSFQRAVENYAGVAANETAADKKELAQKRIAHFREELVAAREELRTLKAAKEASLAAQSRSELFRRANAARSGVSENPFGNTAYNSAQQQQQVDRGQALMNEGDVLSRATQNLDEFISMGRNALQGIGDQNEILRRTQKSMRKVANTLGISNETIRKVERCAKEDKWIFYGGAITMLLVFYLIIRWLR